MEKPFKSILLVEDNENDIEMILSALQEYNLANEITVTKNGEEALEYLTMTGKYLMREKGNPIVILLDMKLPGMNGLDILKHIRADENLASIPVVILTSSIEEKDINASYENGANAYVVKPVDFHEFVDAVKRVGSFWALINEPS